MTFEDKSIQELIDLTGNIYYTIRYGHVVPVEFHEVNVSARENFIQKELKFYDMVKESAFTETISFDTFGMPFVVYEDIEDCMREYLRLTVVEDMHPNKLKVIKDYKRMYGKIFPEELI